MSAYKDSGIKWLGKIPAHWEVVRNSLIFIDLKEVVGENSQNYTLLSLTKQGIIPRDMESGKGKFPAEFNIYKIVNPNNLVFCLFDIDETPRAVGISNDNGMITGAYNVFLIQNANPRYIYYYYLSVDDKKALKPYYTSLRKVINLETFMSIRTPLPPLEEQKKIADFLDEKCKKIDYFIAKQTKFIELLKEQKQVLINQATTKGLNKSTELKDTHIPHLGKIPTHWEIKPLKYLGFLYFGLSGKKGKDFSKDKIQDFKPYIPFINICKNHYLDNELLHYVKIEENETQNKVLKYDLFFMSSSETKEEIGKNAIYLGDEKELYLNSFCRGFRITSNEINPLFINYLLSSKTYRYYFSSSSNGDIRINLKKEIIENLLVLLPPLEEQEKIAKYLDDKCEKIDKAINNITKQISLIQEYKTSLIDTTTKGMLKEVF